MLWKLRVIVYGCLAIVAALVLIGGGDDAPVFLEGRTDQDNTFRMELEDGRPVNVGTYLDATCDDGAPWRTRWWSFDGRTSRFRFDDGELLVNETVTREYDGGWTAERRHSLVARVGDDGARGVMRYHETMRRQGDAYRCSSGAVRFSTGR